MRGKKTVCLVTIIAASLVFMFVFLAGAQDFTSEVGGDFMPASDSGWSTPAQMAASEDSSGEMTESINAAFSEGSTSELLAGVNTAFSGDSGLGAGVTSQFYGEGTPMSQDIVSDLYSGSAPVALGAYAAAPSVGVQRVATTFQSGTSLPHSFDSGFDLVNPVTAPPDVAAGQPLAPAAGTREVIELSGLQQGQHTGVKSLSGITGVSSVSTPKQESSFQTGTKPDYSLQVKTNGYYESLQQAKAQNGGPETIWMGEAAKAAPPGALITDGKMDETGKLIVTRKEGGEPIAPGAVTTTAPAAEPNAPATLVEGQKTAPVEATAAAAPAGPQVTVPKAEAVMLMSKSLSLATTAQGAMDKSLGDKQELSLQDIEKTLEANDGKKRDFTSVEIKDLGAFTGSLRSNGDSHMYMVMAQNKENPEQWDTGIISVRAGNDQWDMRDGANWKNADLTGKVYAFVPEKDMASLKGVEAVTAAAAEVAATETAVDPAVAANSADAVNPAATGVLPLIQKDNVEQLVLDRFGGGWGQEVKDTFKNSLSAKESFSLKDIQDTLNVRNPNSNWETYKIDDAQAFSDNLKTGYNKFTMLTQDSQDPSKWNYNFILTKTAKNEYTMQNGENWKPEDIKSGSYIFVPKSQISTIKGASKVTF